MLLPLVLASLLTVDVPIAPTPPNAAGGDDVSPIFAVETASRRFVLFGETKIHELTADGVRPVATLPGVVDSVTAVGEDLLLVYLPHEGSQRQIVRMSADGTFGTSRPLEVFSLKTVMASNGEAVLLFTDPDAEVLVLDGDGNVVRRGLRPTQFPMIELPGIAAGEDSFLLAWLENFTLRARVVAADGSFLTDSILLSEDASWPSIANDGRRFLVTWRSIGGIKARRLTFDGALLGEEIAIAPPVSSLSGPVAGWDGLQYSVVFDDLGDLYRVRVTRGGVAGPRELLAGGVREQTNPSVSGSLIAWRDRSPCYTGGRAMASVGGSEPILVSIGRPRRLGAQTAAIGNTFATVWVEVADDVRIRVRAGDAIVDLSDRASVAQPAIAAAGDRAVVVWSETYEESCQTRLVAAVIDASGNVLGRTNIDASAFYFAAASDGADFAVVWTTSPTGTTTSLEATRIDRDGRMITEPRVVASTVAHRFSDTRWLYPSIVWTGEEYLAVWQRAFAGQGLLMQRISRTLDPIESVRTVNDAGSPVADIAAGPSTTLVVHRDGAQIRGVLFDSDSGAELRTLVLEESLSMASLPAVAARGAEFIVIVGNDVLRVGEDGSISLIATLPGDAFDYFIPIADRSIAVNGSTVRITYEREGEIFLRTLSFARRQSVRH